MSNSRTIRANNPELKGDNFAWGEDVENIDWREFARYEYCNDQKKGSRVQIPRDLFATFQLLSGIYDRQL